MKLMEAAALASLKVITTPVRERSCSALELAQEIFAEAEGRGEPFLYLTPEKWAKKWLPSKRFRLTRMPLNAAALPCSPRGSELVIKKVYAREERPIVIDYNKNQVGKALNGFTPQVVVLDGKHRFQAATLRGESHIMAWVGEEAIKEIQEREVRASKVFAGGASGGSGGGPAPDRLTPAPGGRLVAKGKKLTKIAATAPPGDNCEEMVKALKRSNDDASAFKIAWAHYDEHGTCAKSKGK